MVTKGDETEHSLYNKMRNAEYARQKQEQTVRRMQQQLADLKRKNAIRVKTELAETHREEKELEQSLIREKAELDKVRGALLMNFILCVITQGLILDFSSCLPLCTYL
jgi:hypothetical protein